jgi:tRNA modification GTPase
MQRIEQADLVLLLCPCDEAPGSEERALLDSDRALLVASKSDRVPGGSKGWTEGAIKVSVRTGEGIDLLRETVFRKLANATGLSVHEALITDARHHEALRSCAARLGSARRAIQAQAPDEVTLVDLHAALNHLGEITGSVTIEQIHERIFSSFCIGK